MSYQNQMYETAFDSTTRRKYTSELSEEKIDQVLNQSLEVQKKRATRLKNFIPWIKVDNKRTMRNSLSLNEIEDRHVADNIVVDSVPQKCNSFNTSSELSDDHVTLSSESRPSTSFGSFSSDSSNVFPHNPQYLKNFLSCTKNKVVKLLSPISDKSYQDISISDTATKNINNVNYSAVTLVHNIEDFDNLSPKKCKKSKKLSLPLTKMDFDSGISLQSNNSDSMLQSSLNDFDDLPLDVPKLDQKPDECELQIPKDIPFDMPKLKNRMSNSSNNIRLDKMKSNRANLFLEGICSIFSRVEINCLLPLKNQEWYHGYIDRHEAENILRTFKDGSFLLRNQGRNKSDYILSIKIVLGFIHVKIVLNTDSKYMFSKSSMTFSSIPEMIQFYTFNRLPVNGAQHLCLSMPVSVQCL